MIDSKTPPRVVPSSYTSSKMINFTRSRNAPPFKFLVRESNFSGVEIKILPSTKSYLDGSVSPVNYTTLTFKY